VCIIGYSLPLLAFLACVFLSIIKDFKLANRTHCRVFNVFPSISSCISEFYPQNTIWRICIAIDSFPRYCIAYVYYKRYYALKLVQLKHQSLYSIFAKFIMVIHVIELSSLLILTYISSMEIFYVHAVSFITFLIASIFYMLSTIGTYYWPRKSTNGLTKKEMHSKSLKLRIFSFYILYCFCSMYFYYRHNRYCEPFVYSLFSLSEYLLILLNIRYHSQIIIDLDVDSNNFKIAMLEMNSN
jgi:hypothetical protein